MSKQSLKAPHSYLYSERPTPLSLQDTFEQCFLQLEQLFLKTHIKMMCSGTFIEF